MIPRSPAMRKKKNANHVQRVSERDDATLTRLERRLGRHGLIEYLQSRPEPKPIKKSSGPPRVTRRRQCLLAVLYHCRLARGHTSISAFAKRLPSIVEIKSSRRTPPSYTSIKSTSALEADLRRGIRESSSKDYLNMLDGLLIWRFVHVNPEWGSV